MGLNRPKILETTEIVLLGISIISVIIGGITGQLIYPIVFIALTQILSLLNRLRFEQISRRRISGLNKQIKNQNPDLATNITAVKKGENQGILERIKKLEEIYIYIRQEVLGLLETPAEGPLAEAIITTESNTLTRSLGSVPELAEMIIPTYQARYELNSHQETVSSLSISPDGRYLVSASWDQTLRLWEIKTGKLLKKVIAHSSGILAIVFLGQQERVHLATGSFDQTIKLWQIKQNSQEEIEIDLKATLRDHSGSIQSLAFNPASGILVSGSYDQTVKQWKMPEGQLLATGYDQSGSIYVIACDPLGQYVASAGGDGKVILWQLGTKDKLGSLIGNIFSVQSLAISPDGKMVAAGCINGQIVLWQIETDQLSQTSHKPLRIFKAHTGPIKTLVFQANLEEHNSPLLFSGGSDGNIYLWHLNSTNFLAELKYSNDDLAENKPISSLILSSDGRYLVAGDISGKIKIWLRE